MNKMNLLPGPTHLGKKSNKMGWTGGALANIPRQERESSRPQAAPEAMRMSCGCAHSEVCDSNAAATKKRLIRKKIQDTFEPAMIRVIAVADPRLVVIAPIPSAGSHGGARH
jgi:hypothetical protein